MRIATFNINNINKRLANLLDWLMIAQPDVVCLQELKAEDRGFPLAAIENAGYGAVWCGQRAWNGVAILARGATPVITRRTLPGDPADDQARYIEAAVNGVLIASIYLPNGNPQPGPKFAYKLAWFERLITHAAEVMAAGVPVVLAGDYNVVATEADIWPGHREQDNAILRPESRAAFQKLLGQGWTDALCARQPEGPLWTFWSYLRHRWPNDKRHAARPSPTESRLGSPFGGHRHQPHGPGQAGSQRPRADVDRVRPRRKAYPIGIWGAPDDRPARAPRPGRAASPPAGKSQRPIGDIKHLLPRQMPWR